MHIKTVATVLLVGAFNCTAATSAAPATADIIRTYADIALASYEDSLTSAQHLQTTINTLLQNPDANTLKTARSAWIAARSPYQQSEAYRFGNAIVDDWEGRVNSWPLDEGLIDYVATGHYGSESDENTQYRANVIANTTLRVGGTLIDASRITPELLSGTLHEVDGKEANVATGYQSCRAW